MKKCQYLRNRITRSKQVLRSIQVEIRGLAAVDASPWESKSKEYEEKISKFLQDIEWAENSQTASAAQGSGAGNGGGKKTIDEMTTGDITKHALRVQDKTQESTQRAKKALDETIEVYQ